MGEKRTCKNDWAVVRTKDNEAQITLPAGLEFTAEKIAIEDIIEAYQRQGVLEDGHVSGDGTISVKCCSGNTAIA